MKMKKIIAGNEEGITEVLKKFICRHFITPIQPIESTAL